MKLQNLVVLFSGLALGGAQTFCNYDTAPRPGKNVICNFEGSVADNGSFFGGGGHQTYESCRNFALQPPAAASFSYEASALQCNIFRSAVKPMKPMRGNTGVVFWDTKCFKAYSYKQQAVRNPTFETAKFYPWKNHTAPGHTFVGVVQRKDSELQFGTYSALITGSATDEPVNGNAYTASITQTFFLCNSTAWKFDFAIYEVAATSTISGQDPSLLVRLKSPSGAYPVNAEVSIFSDHLTIDSVVDVPQGTWASNLRSFQPSENGRYLAEFLLTVPPGSSARIRLDNIKVSPS